MNEINFTANYIKNVTIQKRYYNKYKPHTVTLIEMDSKNKHDIDAIYKTANLWDTSFTAFTYDDMRGLNKNIDTEKLHVYALTTQKDNFHKPTASKILGIAEIYEMGSTGNKIEVLQSNTDHIYNKYLNKTPRYKHIGKTLLNFVKENFSDKDLYLTPTKTAVPFYEKEGWIWKGFNKLKNLMWNPKNK